MRRRRFAAGEVIFREGDPSDEAFLLQTGRVEVLKNSPRGPFRLAVLHEGDVLGEMGVLEERPRSATAHALDDVVADAVSATEFAHMLTHDPTGSHRILRALFERLRAVNTRLSETPPAPAQAPALRVRLVPTTDETRAVLPPDGIELPRLPFRIGRTPRADESALMQLNELEFPDRDPYVLSPNHFAIDAGDGAFVVRDRGSLYGTHVNGEKIGAGALVDLATIDRGDIEIVAGPPRALAARRASPFRFRLLVE